MNYSKEECCQCITECMVESLPRNWKSAWMEAEISGNEISVNYFYKSGIFNKTSKFKTSNIFAPMNAMKAIQGIMSSEGKAWSKAKFSIWQNGKFAFEVIA